MADNGLETIRKAILGRRGIQLTDPNGNCPIRPEYDHLFSRGRFPTLMDRETPGWCSRNPCTCYWRLVEMPPALMAIASNRDRYERLEAEWNEKIGPIASA